MEANDKRTNYGPCRFKFKDMFNQNLIIISKYFVYDELGGAIIFYM